MRGTASRRAAKLGWLASMALAAVGAVLQGLSPDAPLPSVFAFRGWDLALAVVLASVGALIGARRPQNTIGWLLLAGGLVAALSYFAGQYAVYSIVAHDGSLAITDGAAWLQNWIWIPIVGILGIFVPQLFPDGKPLSPAWGRFLMVFAPLALAIFSAGIAFAPGTLDSLVSVYENPYTVSPGTAELLEGIGGMGFGVSMVGSIVSVVKRYRRSRGTSRLQMKWLALSSAALGFTLGVVGTPVYLLIPGAGDGTAGWGVEVVEIAIVTSILAVPVATGIAILRHRLFDIDVVISKAVVFGTLGASITAVYVAVVVGVGAAVGARGEPNVALSVGATAAVALLFQPLRSWAQRVAGRLVYGKRATPHEILSVLGTRIAEAYSLDDVLPRIARLVTEATPASRAEVWIRIGGSLRMAAAWPEGVKRMPLEMPGAEAPSVPDADLTFPVRHQGELLGVLAVAAPANDQITEADERLLADLASHAGLVLRNVRLIEELRASRQRLVSTQDEERRRIERDLHDGAQQELVALGIKVRLVRSLLESDRARALGYLEELQAEVGSALEGLRDLARGIYPKSLVDGGLGPALRQHAEKMPLPVDVQADAIGRYPDEIEAAVYFCVREALQNSTKYASASHVVVRLGERDGRLHFTVTDDGAGFDTDIVARGTGTNNMSDRLEVLGGSLEVASRPGAGTSVHGSVPLPPNASGGDGRTARATRAADPLPSA